MCTCSCDWSGRCGEFRRIPNRYVFDERNHPASTDVHVRAHGLYSARYTAGHRAVAVHKDGHGQ